MAAEDIVTTTRRKSWHLPAAPDTARPWWERYPQRWATEQAALDAAGIGWQRQDADSPGVLQLHIEVVIGDRPVELTADYPSTYPFFPPLVSDPAGTLAHLQRHRSPRHGQLCLLHDDSWHVDTTLAQLLTTQLPLVLATGARGAEQRHSLAQLRELEAPAAEPLATRVQGTAGMMLLVDSAWDIPPDVTSGPLQVMFRSNPLTSQAVGVVTAVYAGLGGPLVQLDAATRHANVPVFGRWLKLDALPDVDDPELLYQAVKDKLPTVEISESTTTAEKGTGAAEPKAPELSLRQLMFRECHGRVDVIGLRVPQEHRYRTPGGTGWLFLLRTRPDRRSRWKTELVLTGYAGPADTSARHPAGARLADARVAVIGCGAIGSTLAVSLARSGVGDFMLIDRDVLEPGNLARHAAGVDDLGRMKASVLRDLVESANVHARAGAALIHLGDEYGPGDYHHAEIVEAFADQADVVVDATADPAATRYLAAVCRARSTTFVTASGTAGAWGGLVVRIRPGEDLCWGCIAHHRADGSDGALPVPPADPVGTAAIQPVGCWSPTFTGSGTDLDQIALMAARVVASTLLTDIASAEHDAGLAASVEPAGGDLPGNAWVASLRDPDGHPIPISWQAITLARHPACPTHLAASAYDNGARRAA